MNGLRVQWWWSNPQCGQMVGRPGVVGTRSVARGGLAGEASRGASPATAGIAFGGSVAEGGAMEDGVSLLQDDGVAVRRLEKKGDGG